MMTNTIKMMNDMELNLVNGGTAEAWEYRDPTMNNRDVICAIPGYVEKKVAENQGVIDLVTDYAGKAL
ncbi:MAG: hypothetical protein J6V25_06700, partial [Oscillospiraceae bacterium]|nr:hypothetical protein [Oscillospiraceae bacterium]